MAPPKSTPKSTPKSSISRRVLEFIIGGKLEDWDPKTQTFRHPKGNTSESESSINLLGKKYAKASSVALKIFELVRRAEVPHVPQYVAAKLFLKINELTSLLVGSSKALGNGREGGPDEERISAIAEQLRNQLHDLIEKCNKTSQEKKAKEAKAKKKPGEDTAPTKEERDKAVKILKKCTAAMTPSQKDKQNRAFKLPKSTPQFAFARAVVYDCRRETEELIKQVKRWSREFVDAANTTEKE